MIELMLVLAIMAGLLTLALPSFNGYLERNRLKAAAEGLSSDLHYARSESLLRDSGSEMTVSFTTDGSNTWCYGMTTAASCDCTVSDPNSPSACLVEVAGEDVLRVVESDDFQGTVNMPTVTLPSNEANFTGIRALVDSGIISLQANNQQVDVNLTAVGRVRICSDAKILGYPSC